MDGIRQNQTALYGKATRGLEEANVTGRPFMALKGREEVGFGQEFSLPVALRLLFERRSVQGGERLFD